MAAAGADGDAEAQGRSWRVMHMQGASRLPRLDSGIPPDHPLKVAVEATVIEALTTAEDWTCRIVASTAVTCWIVEFVRTSDGQKEDVLVQPSRFDHERFRNLVAAALRT